MGQVLEEYIRKILRDLGCEVEEHDVHAPGCDIVIPNIAKFEVLNHNKGTYSARA